MALAIVLACAGCAALPHPAALSGEWVDGTKTTAADTSVWILDPHGNDLSMHVAARPEGGGGGAVVSRPQLYGRWYVSGRLADTTGRSLCFVQRPGRDAPSCVRFHMDTVLVRGAMVRRLFLEAYQGSHDRADRVLLERRP